MDWLSGSVITLALTMLGAVWRMSALVSELKSLREEMKAFHADFRTHQNEVSMLRTKVAVLEARGEDTGRIRLVEKEP